MSDDRVRWSGQNISGHWGEQVSRFDQEYLGPYGLSYSLFVLKGLVFPF